MIAHASRKPEHWPGKTFWIRKLFVIGERWYMGGSRRQKPSAPLTRVHHLLKPSCEALQAPSKLKHRMCEVVDRDNRTVRKEKLRLVSLHSRNNEPFYENVICERFWKAYIETRRRSLARPQLSWSRHNHNNPTSLR